MAEPYFRPLSGTTARVAGVLTLLIGLGASVALIVNLFYFGQFILGGDAAHAFNAFNLIIFAVFAPMLCIAGFRLIGRDTRRVGSILPRALWLIIGIIFIVGGIFTAVMALYTGVAIPFLTFSALMVGGLGIQSVRVGMRRKEYGAPSNKRWRGP